MGNIDETILNSLLSRIGTIKAELESLETEIKTLGASAASQDENIDLNLTAAIEAEEGIDISISPDDVVVNEYIETPVPEPVAEQVEEPVAVPVAVPVAEPAVEVVDVPAEEPVADLEIEPVEVAVPEPAPESVVEPVVAPAPEVVVEPVAEPEDDLPFFEDSPAPAPVVPEKKEKVRKAAKAIVDSMTAETAVMDVMADQQAWKTDRVGTPVKNVISAISLNDRVLLINVLFKEDPMLFQETVSAFNSMSSFDEAVAYIGEKFPDWDLNSEPVYRLMMAARRKLG